MNSENFFKHPKLSFAECRYSRNSGRHYKPHIHQTFSIGAIDEGEVVYRVAENRAKLQPGSLALINPETLHSCNPLESCKRSYYMLYLDVVWCLKLQQSLWKTEAFRPVHTILLENRRIYQQFIIAMQRFMDEGDLFEKEQLLIELAGQVFLQACNPGIATPVSSLDIDPLKIRLGADLDHDVTLSQIASDLQANPYTLLRQFKAATGITPHAYRLNCRIEHAKQLLRKGCDPCQVALDCGFCDQSHFHRHFKAMTTVTPKEYQVNFVQ